VVIIDLNEDSLNRALAALTDKKTTSIEELNSASHNNEAISVQALKTELAILKNDLLTEFKKYLDEAKREILTGNSKIFDISRKTKIKSFNKASNTFFHSLKVN
jgi:hypothetical protein